jgi:hypothetical protein
MMALMMFLIFVALVGSMLGALADLFKPDVPPPFADTEFGATKATRSQLKQARVLRRKLR